MSLPRALLLSTLALVMVAGVIVAVIFLQPKRQSLNAAELAKLVAADLPATQAQYLNRPVRVTGIVRLSLEIQGDEGPYYMIELENAKGLELHAAFLDPDVVMLGPGAEIVFDGVCSLCDSRVVYFDDCVLVSQLRPGFAFARARVSKMDPGISTSKGTPHA